MTQTVKNPPAIPEIWVRSLAWEDPLEEDMAIHSSILAWRIPVDRGAWRTTQSVGVAKSRTLEQLSTSTQWEKRVKSAWLLTSLVGGGGRG